jgi:hypothetical protein
MRAADLHVSFHFSAFDPIASRSAVTAGNLLIVQAAANAQNAVDLSICRFVDLIVGTTLRRKLQRQPGRPSLAASLRASRW